MEILSTSHKNRNYLWGLRRNENVTDSKISDPTIFFHAVDIVWLLFVCSVGEFLDVLSILATSATSKNSRPMNTANLMNKLVLWTIEQLTISVVI